MGPVHGGITLVRTRIVAGRKNHPGANAGWASPEPAQQVAHELFFLHTGANVGHHLFATGSLRVRWRMLVENQHGFGSGYRRPMGERIHRTDPILRCPPAIVVTVADIEHRLSFVIARRHGREWLGICGLASLYFN